MDKVLEQVEEIDQRLVDVEQRLRRIQRLVLTNVRSLEALCARMEAALGVTPGDEPEQPVVSLP